MAVRRNAVNRAVIAAGNEKQAVAVEREARGIHQLGDEGLHRVGRRDFVERDRNFLPALAAESDVHVASESTAGFATGCRLSAI